MINFKNAKTIGSLLMGALLVVACENSDSEIENDLDIENIDPADQGEVLELDSTVVFSMHLGAEVTEEDAKIEFDKAVDSYLSSLPESKSEAFSTEWFTNIYLYTGTQTDNDTNGKVRSAITYETSKGRHYASSVVLGSGNIDRKGGWDFYLIRDSFPGEAVEWVELVRGSICLQGNDDWFVTIFGAGIVEGDQSILATGRSYFFDYPNEWLGLDNTATSFDCHISFDAEPWGRLEF